MSKKNTSKAAKTTTKINERKAAVPAGRAHSDEELAAQHRGQLVARVLGADIQVPGFLTEEDAERFVDLNGVDALDALTEAQFNEAVDDFAASIEDEPAAEAVSTETASVVAGELADLDKAKAMLDAEDDAEEHDEAPESTEAKAPRAKKTPEEKKAFAKAWAELSKKLGPIHIRAVRQTRAVKRAEALVKTIAAWALAATTQKEEAAREALAQATLAALTAQQAQIDLVKALESVPREFRPKGAMTSTAGRSAKADKVREVGAKVVVRESARKHYEGMLSVMEGTVLAFVGKKVKVQTTEGIVFIARGHLAPATAPAAAPVAAE